MCRSSSSAIVELVSSTTTTTTTTTTPTTPTTTTIRSVGLARDLHVSVAHILPGMPSNPWCQHCQAHRSRFRRLCKGCAKLVAPGCLPQRCLVRDAYSGDHFSICRSCFEDRHRRLLKGATRRLDSVMDIVFESGF